MKVDVYALGITIYELWGAFTYQSRWNEINYLKENGVRETFRNKFPVIADLVSHMIDHDVFKRFSI